MLACPLFEFAHGYSVLLLDASIPCAHVQGVFPRSPKDVYHPTEMRQHTHQRQAEFVETAKAYLQKMLDTMPEHLAPDAILYFGVSKTKRMAGAGRL